MLLQQDGGSTKRRAGSSHEAGAGELAGRHEPWSALSSLHGAVGSPQVCLNGGMRRSDLSYYTIRISVCGWPVLGQTRSRNGSQVEWRGGLAATDAMAGLTRTVAVETGSKEPGNTWEVKSTGPSG